MVNYQNRKRTKFPDLDRCLLDTMTIPSTLVFVSSLSTLLVALVISSANGQQVDIALDKGRVTGQLPMRTIAIKSGNKTAVNCVLMVPMNPKFGYSYVKVMPEVELALQKIDSNPYLLPHHYLRLRYFDTKCDDTVPMNNAINAHIDGFADVFFGPCCDYSLAPISRQAPLWDTPIITFGANAPDFKKLKLQKFSTLTRAGPYDVMEMVDLLINRITFFQWKKLNLLYANNIPEFYFLAIALTEKCEEKNLTCEPAALRDNPEPGPMLEKLLGLDYSGPRAYLRLQFNIQIVNQKKRAYVQYGGLPAADWRL